MQKTLSGFDCSVTAAVKALGALGLGRSSSRWQTDIRFIYFLSSRAIFQK
jgi:hypothetical protein